MQTEIEALGEIIRYSPPRRMKFIGSTGLTEGAKCETVNFRSQDIGTFSQLVEVVVFTDIANGVTSLNLVVAHNEAPIGDDIEVF